MKYLSIAALWKLVAQYGGVVLALIVMASIICGIVYKRIHRNRVEVIVVTENDSDDIISVSDRRKIPQASLISGENIIHYFS